MSTRSHHSRWALLTDDGGVLGLFSDIDEAAAHFKRISRQDSDAYGASDEGGRGVKKVGRRAPPPGLHAKFAPFKTAKLTTSLCRNPGRVNLLCGQGAVDVVPAFHHADPHAVPGQFRGRG